MTFDEAINLLKRYRRGEKTMIRTIDAIKYRLASIYADDIKIKDLKLEVKLNGVEIPLEVLNNIIDSYIKHEVDIYKTELTQMLINKLKEDGGGKDE